MDWTKPVYQTPDVTKLTGAQQPKIRQWILSGLITPDKPARGSGYPARYSLRNVLQVAILQRLAEMSLSLQAARLMADRFIELMDLIDIDYHKAARSPSWVYASTDGKQATLAMKGTLAWNDCIGLNLTPIMDEIAKGAEEIT